MALHNGQQHLEYDTPTLASNKNMLFFWFHLVTNFMGSKPMYLFIGGNALNGSKLAA